MGEGEQQQAAKAASAATIPAAPGVPKRARRDAADALAAELRGLRGTLDEIVEHLLLRIGSQLADLERGVAGRSAGTRTPRPPAKVRAAMLQRVRELKVKPRKGRIKDLERLAALIEELLAVLPE